MLYFCLLRTCNDWKLNELIQHFLLLRVLGLRSLSIESSHICSFCLTDMVGNAAFILLGGHK